MLRVLVWNPLCFFVCLLLHPAVPHQVTPTPTREDTAKHSSGQAQDFPEELGGDPVVFLKKALKRYDNEIHGCSLVLRKKEWDFDAGKLRDTEEIEVYFKDQPHSVYFYWRRSNPTLTDPRSVLYVEGKNNNRLKVLTGFPLPLDLPLSDDRVRKTSRYPINEFGFRKATQRVLDHWEPAQRAGTLHVKIPRQEANPRNGRPLVLRVSPHEVRPQGRHQRRGVGVLLRLRDLAAGRLGAVRRGQGRQRRARGGR
jgi:hypothetical protein